MAVAIEVAGVSKSFRIPHENRTYLKEYFLHPFGRTTYERNDALQNATFSVEAGEFFGVFGPNGSGKSTLLKTILSNTCSEVVTAPVEIEFLVVRPCAKRRETCRTRA